jgi:pyridoxal phosphate enzyme (YggS family)
MNDLQTATSNFFNLKNEVGDKITITIASKTVKTELLIEFIRQTGHLDFGENYASELSKWDAIIEEFNNIRLSFIGSFQTGNLRKIVKYCNKIEGISSLKELEKVQKESLKHNKKVICYAQINIGEETQKNGFKLSDILIDDLKKFDGLMCIPPALKPVDEYFKKMQNLKEECGLSSLSMGMSGDYKKAILSGSTEIRVGSLIFGGR